MTHKEWKTVGGPRVRASHMNANGQKVLIDENFRVGGEELFLPSDPNASFVETANCRCEVRFTREGIGAGATRVSERGIEFIKRHEGFEPIIDGDPVELDTIGYGHKLTAADVASKRFVNGIIRAEAETLLRQDIAVAERAIARLINVPLTQNQFDALASLIFNIGASKFAGFNVRHETNNRNFEAAAREFLDIDLARDRDGVLRPFPGLTTRRHEESVIFLTPDN
ncbi:MAG: lysozyme [Sphingomonadales bacterium]|jgi:lysozyme